MKADKKAIVFEPFQLEDVLAELNKQTWYTNMEDAAAQNEALVHYIRYEYTNYVALMSYNKFTQLAETKLMAWMDDRINEQILLLLADQMAASREE